MELRPGYKHTDVGLIPNDWDVSTVGAEFAVQLGKMLDSERNFGVNKPYLGNKSVQWDRIDISDIQMIPMSQSDLNKFRLQAGDLLVCEGGEVGRAAIWDAQIEECYYQKALHRLRPLRGFEPKLMVAILQLWARRGMLANFVTQTSIAHLPKEKFVEVPIPRPSAGEQRAIATALSDVDALIAGLEKLIAKKRDLKQAAMQQLLTGQTRLPGFSGEWEVKRLGDTAILKARIGWQGLTTAEYLDSGDFYLVTGTEFDRGYINWKSCHFVDESRYKQDKHIQLKLHDVLVTKDGTIGKVALISDLPAPATLNSGVFVIRPVEEAFHPEFFYYLLCSNIFVEFLNQLSAGSTINHLYQKDFVGFTYRTPPTLEEQTAIATVLSDMDAELAALEARLAKTRALKQGMMQELLTGRTRLV
ncbi:restriction endonuclease subunit S [Aquitalea palustris]|uniref:Restriction endonuclease subunit S n=1 Tax=Aquitalea palustris TaxID=2480983 RepID=A0A454JL44_9NEIS|nr:restriction endonuclease subunit S [Aquitalea palustris]RMD00150.1 restriction endonuclease subunit S [Aquitalea palustris]